MSRERWRKSMRSTIPFEERACPARGFLSGGLRRERGSTKRGPVSPRTRREQDEPVTRFAVQLTGMVGETIGLPASRSARQLQSGLGMGGAGLGGRVSTERPSVNLCTDSRLARSSFRTKEGSVGCALARSVSFLRTSRSCGRLSAPLGGRAVPAHFPEGPFPVPSLEGRSLRVPVIQQRRAAASPGLLAHVDCFRLTRLAKSRRSGTPIGRSPPPRSEARRK